MTPQPQSYRFLECEIAPETGRLRRSGEDVHLEPRVFRLLVYLIEHRERLVPKRELLEAVWGDAYVTENALTKAVGRLRLALADDAQKPRYIQTHHSLGYRFIAEVLDAAPPLGDEAGEVPAPPRGTRVRTGRWILPVAAAALVAGVVALVASLPDGSSSRNLAGKAGDAPEIRSLAVLPLDNLTGDPEQGYFVEGIHEALITDLSKIGSIRVISRQSARRFASSEKSAPQIARELGVDGLVEGSVIRDGERIGIWAQLIHGPSDRHLWAEEYSREAGDVLFLVSDVAKSISGEIRGVLTPEESRRLSGSRPVAPKAYDLHLRARHHVDRFDRGALLEARKLYLEALDVDPTFAPAYSGLGYSYLMGAVMGGPPAHTMPPARAAALRAIELDEYLAEAWTVLGWVRLAYDWEWSESEAAFGRALELNPNDPIARHGYADYLTAMGRLEEALGHAVKVRECDPLSPMSYVPVLGHLTFLRRYDRVIEEGRRTLELFPGFRSAHRWLAWALWNSGRHEEALEHFRAGSSTEVADALERGLAAGGPAGASRALAEVLQARASSEYVDPLRIAAAWAGANERELALDWLDKAAENRSPLLGLITVRAEFDSLRSEPRFRDLLRRIGLAA